MSEAYFVSPTLEECESILDHAILESSISGTFLDRYEITHPSGGRCVVLLYEKHYYRVGNRLTLTVTLDDFTGKTRLHCASGGGGSGLTNFDWGAAESFEEVVHNAFRDLHLTFS